MGSDGTGQRLGKVTLSKVAFGEAAWDTPGGLDSDTGGFTVECVGSSISPLAYGSWRRPWKVARRRLAPHSGEPRYKL